MIIGCLAKDGPDNNHQAGDESNDTRVEGAELAVHSRLEHVIPALSANQAKLLHLDQYGEIRTGFRADLTFIGGDDQVAMTMVSGEVVYP